MAGVDAEDGKVILWGWAEHGQLGLGSLEDQEVPHIVWLASQARLNPPDVDLVNQVGSECERVSSSSSSCSRVYCGSGFTFVTKFVS